MKQRDLVKKLEAMGCVFIRHGGTIGIKTHAQKYPSRFLDIERSKEQLAKHIIKMLSNGNTYSGFHMG